MNIKPRSQRIAELYEYYTEGKMDLSPVYQRNSVWDDNMRSYLIDTILKGYTMPPIFIRSVVDSKTRKTKYEVLDGQQRLKTIFSFIDDGFFVKRIHNQEYFNKTFSELEEDVQYKVLEFETSVMDVSGALDQEIYELFARLNSNNIKLKSQEIRNAKYHGQFKMFVISENKKWSENIFNVYKVFSKNQKARMDDVEFLTQLALLSLNGIVEGGKKDLDNLYEEYDNKDVPSKLENNLKELFDLFNDEQYAQDVMQYKKLGNKSYIYAFSSHYLSVKEKIEKAKYLQFIKWFIEYLEKVENNLVKDSDIDEFLKLIVMRTTNKNSREKRFDIINAKFENNFKQ